MWTATLRWSSLPYGIWARDSHWSVTGGDPTKSSPWIRPIQSAHPSVRLLTDEHIAEEKARLILVVRTAAELNVANRGGAARCVRRDVMELEESGLPASSCTPNKTATSVVRACST